MHFYPQLSGPRSRTIAADLVVVLLIALFAWSGMKVHDTVTDLNSISRGVQDAGTSVQDGFKNVAGAVSGIPIVGGSLSDSLGSAGQATGGNVVAAGRQGRRRSTTPRASWGGSRSRCRRSSCSRSSSRCVPGRSAG